MVGEVLAIMAGTCYKTQRFKYEIKLDCVAVCVGDKGRGVEGELVWKNYQRDPCSITSV